MRDISHPSRCLLGSVLALLFAGSMAFGQAVSSASIAGTVRDSSGSVLPGVTVTSTQTDTGLTRVVVSDEAGRYTISNLAVGPYKLEFMLQGFRTFVQTGIVLQVSGSPTINAALELGAVEESVTVEGESPLIETRSVGIGMVVDNQRVLELPLNGRETLDLVYQTGMAVSGGTLGGARGGATSTSPGTIAVAGGLANGTTYTLDGATHNDPFNGSSMPLPFPEALQEFKVETSALPAQYGHHSAAAVNAVTKSGTNMVSGTAFEFLRDDALNARDPFASIGADGKPRTRRPESQPVRRRDWRPPRSGQGVLLCGLPAHQDPAGPDLLVPVRTDGGDAERRFHGHRLGGVQHKRSDCPQGRVCRQQDQPGSLFSGVGEAGKSAAENERSLRQGLLRPHQQQ